jgi:hypothetical protein
MKILFQLFVVIVFFALFIRCDKNETNPGLDDFCAVAPAGWDCEIIQGNFNPNEIPKNAEQPMAIIKYFNRDKKFISFGTAMVNPSLILQVYPIAKKEELIRFIRSQQIFSWCIPIYYGETKAYFITTSPCFINGGSFTSEANLAIEDLHTALKSLITVVDYNFAGK